MDLEKEHLIAKHKNALKAKDDKKNVKKSPKKEKKEFELKQKKKTRSLSTNEIPKLASKGKARSPRTRLNHGCKMGGAPFGSALF